MSFDTSKFQLNDKQYEYIVAIQQSWKLEEELAEVQRKVSSNHRRYIAARNALDVRELEMVWELVKQLNADRQRERAKK